MRNLPKFLLRKHFGWVGNFILKWSLIEKLNEFVWENNYNIHLTFNIKNIIVIVIKTSLIVKLPMAYLVLNLWCQFSHFWFLRRIHAFELSIANLILFSLKINFMYWNNCSYLKSKTTVITNTLVSWKNVYLTFFSQYFRCVLSLSVRSVYLRNQSASLEIIKWSADHRLPIPGPDLIFTKFDLCQSNINRVLYIHSHFCFK